MLELDVRETQDAALQIYRHYGYVEWGRHPFYAQVDGRPVAGLFFYKQLNDRTTPELVATGGETEKAGS